MDLRLVLGRALALVPPQQQEIEEAVAERLPAQRRHPRRQHGRNELRPIVQLHRDIRRSPASRRARCRRPAPASGSWTADFPPSAARAAGWWRPRCARSRDDRQARVRAPRSSPCARTASGATNAASSAPLLVAVARATRSPFAKGKKSAYWHKTTQQREERRMGGAGLGAGDRHDRERRLWAELSGKAHHPGQPLCGGRAADLLARTVAAGMGDLLGQRRDPQQAGRRDRDRHRFRRRRGARRPHLADRRRVLAHRDAGGR